MSFIHRYYGLLLSLLFCIPAIAPLFNPGFFPMHDNEQVGRLYDLDMAIKQGHIPPRLAPNLGFGYGYPFFNFYPPFAYYVAWVFRQVGFGYIDSTKLMIIVGFFAAAYGMYLFAKHYFGEAGGIVAAVAYTYTPYHSVDVYVRGALPEFLSFACIPFILYFIARFGKKQNIVDFLAVAISFGVLVLTHNLIAFMSGIFIGLFIILNSFFTKNKMKYIALCFLSIVFGLLMTSYFWLPSFMEKQYTMVDLLTQDLANYSQHFVYARQFWDSPVEEVRVNKNLAWGYGGSIYGLYDGVSFQIGKVQIIAAFISLLIVWLLHKKNKKLLYVSLFLLAAFMLSVFMQTFYSKFIWDLIQPLWYIQFPWRFLLFSAFFGSVLIGSLFLFFQNSKYIWYIAGFTIFIILYLNTPYFRPERYLTSVTDQDYINKTVLRYDTSKLAAEYTPKGIVTRKTDINTSVVAIDKDMIAKSSFEVKKGEMDVKILKDLVYNRKFEVEVKKAGDFIITSYSFPGWNVFVNNTKTRYNNANALKLITVPLQPGRYIIEARFEDTPVRSVGNITSILSLIVMIVVSLYWKRISKYEKIT